MIKRAKKTQRRLRTPRSTQTTLEIDARHQKTQTAPTSETIAAALAAPSESFLNAIYNGIPEAVLAIHMDTRRLVYWNQGAEALFGYSREEVLERTTEFLYADADAFHCLYDLKTLIIQEHGSWRGESRFHRRDGSSFPGEMTLTTFLRTDTNDAYAVVIIHDITKRKQTEEALRQSEERFRQAFDHAATGKALVAPDGKWLSVNRCLCEITGYAESELLATDWRSITHPDDIEADLAYIRRLLTAEIDRYAVEKRYLHKEGRVVWILLSVALVRRSDGNPLYFIAEVQDRTEQKQLEKQLRERERLATIGTTVAKIAHEIGNPLNGMLTTLQVMERDLVGQRTDQSDSLIEAVHDLKHETNRLRSLLQELRAFARPRDLDFQPTNLVEVVDEVLRGQAASYLERNVTIEQRLPADLAPVLADQEKLAQVLLNLCNNAVEAMPQGGRLTVCATLTEGGVCLEVTDVGDGIPEGVNVFEPFATTKAHGTGLGLAIAKQLIEAHGGAITYTSAPEQGTTFRVVLPMKPEN